MVLRRQKEDLARNDRDREFGEWKMVVRPMRKVLVPDN